jgi:putative membrane protein
MPETPQTMSPKATVNRLDSSLLGATYLFISIALAGFATFGLHPELVARVPGAAKSYGLIYANVGHVQVWALWTVLAVFLLRHVGLKWIPAFLAVYAVSFLSEFLGTSYGIPFGGYEYSALLGPKWFDRVPWVIPLSWFTMAVPSFALARGVGAARGPVARILFASALLVAWDLALDPAMSALTPYWIWSETGPYYGMPWMNLVGWYVTAALIMGALTALRADRWIDRVSARWLSGFYGVNLLMPAGMLVAAGSWLGVVVTAGIFAVLGGIAVLTTQRVRGLVPAPAEARP